MSVPDSGGLSVASFDRGLRICSRREGGYGKDPLNRVCLKNLTIVLTIRFRVNLESKPLGG